MQIAYFGVNSRSKSLIRMSEGVPNGKEPPEEEESQAKSKFITRLLEKFKDKISLELL